MGDTILMVQNKRHEHTAGNHVKDITWYHGGFLVETKQVQTPLEMYYHILKQ